MINSSIILLFKKSIKLGKLVDIKHSKPIISKINSLKNKNKLYYLSNLQAPVVKQIFFNSQVRIIKVEY